ncbi:MAG: GntR family transcriptional regulator [Ruthenibacterium sp.]
MRSERIEVLERLKCFLLEQALPSGAQLPGERELAERLGVSRTALRCAIQQMAEDGQLLRHVGAGTYIAPPKIDHPLQHYVALRRMVEATGRSFDTQIVLLDCIACGKAVAAALHLSAGALVYRIRCRRLADNLAFMLDTSYLEAKRFPGLPEYDFEQKPLYEVLRDHYSTRLKKGTAHLRMTYAAASEIEQLHIEEGKALFSITRVARDENNTPIEYAEVTICPDMLQFSILQS